MLEGLAFLITVDGEVQIEISELHACQLPLKYSLSEIAYQHRPVSPTRHQSLWGKEVLLYRCSDRVDPYWSPGHAGGKAVSAEAFGA